MSSLPKILFLALLVVAASAGYTIKEVKFYGGDEGATSFLDNNHAWMANVGFEERMPINKGWHVGQVKGKREAMCPPVMIWYDFKTRHVKPAEMSIQPAQTGAAMQGAPSQWQVVGSNDVNCDDDSNWTVLCEDLSDRKWRSAYEVRYCRMPQNKQEFRCVGIRVLNNLRSDGWTSLRNIRLWEQA